MGVWFAELAAHLRVKAGLAGPGSAGGSATASSVGADVLWYHNVAHDGSLSRVLSVLQVDVMVWPGMASEVVFVFELYRREEESRVGQGHGHGYGYYLRVLWAGRVMTSSSPSLGVMDMVPLGTFLAYVDGLVGVNAGLVPGKCDGSVP